MEWLYTKNEDNTARYVLGTVGDNPLICFGINPSTAAPEDLDNTVKSVARIAKYNGYDSWIMLNLYPQRATNPNDMHNSCDEDILANNIEEIAKLLAKYDSPAIWAAWGTLIEKRKYLRQCLSGVVNGIEHMNCRWITIGKRTKKGHPHHPLYLRTDSASDEFDLHSYINGL